MTSGDMWFVTASEVGATEPDELRRRPWHGPPEDELGVAVALGLVLGRGERGAVGLSHAIVHPTGVLLQLLAVARGLTQAEANAVFHEQFGFGGDELPPGLLRFGLELPGGARLSNVSPDALRVLHEDEEPAAPVLVPTGGGGGQGYSDRAVLRNAYWLWPLPEPGPLRFACEWPLTGIPQTTSEIDGAALVAAASGATPLLPPS
jgi:hypothetical protein